MNRSLSFEFSLARRFLAESRFQTAIIVMGIAIGVAVMVFLTALIDGLQANLIEKTVGRAPHIVISGTDTIVQEAAKFRNGHRLLLLDSTSQGSHPIAEWRTLAESLAADGRIKIVLPVVDGSGLIRRGQVSRSILLRGFDLEKADQMYDISGAIIAGNPKPANGAVLIGKDLAADLGIGAGDPILLELTGQAPLALIVDGVFDLGVSAINQRWLIMDQQKAQALLGIGDRVTSLEAQVFDVFAAQQIASAWQDRYPGYKMESWQATNASLLAGLSSQSSSSYTIQFFVLLAVTLGVASVLAINAVQKSKQIGILKAMGIRTGSVARVFIFQGGMLGLGGAIIGFGLGLLMSQAFVTFASAQFGLLLRPWPLLIIFLTTLMAATLAAYLPARRVARLDPVEVIRNG